MKVASYNILSGGFNSYSDESSSPERLDLLKKAINPMERVISWQRQVKIPLIVNGELIANYYIDFVAEMADGSTQYIEVKGFSTDVWRLKWKLFEAIYKKEHPEIDLIIIR